MTPLAPPQIRRPRRFGILTADGSHTILTSCIAVELRRRGHDIIIYGRENAGARFRENQLTYKALGTGFFAPNHHDLAIQSWKGLAGDSALEAYVADVAQYSSIILGELPALLAADDREILITDQTLQAGDTVAEYLRLPCIHICAALPFARSAEVPPITAPWVYEDSPRQRRKNRLGNRDLLLQYAAVMKEDNRCRQMWGLPAKEKYFGGPSCRLEISHIPREFDFAPPLNMERVYTGPCSSGNTLAAADFPWSRLSGRPLIYASLGTVNNFFPQTFRHIAQAVESLDAQLVLALGHGIDPTGFEQTEKCIVVSLAPQFELLRRSRLFITHCGLNSALEALQAGVPMLGLPVALDQFGVSARIQFHGVGRIQALDAGVDVLRESIAGLLNDDGCLRSARKFQTIVQNSGGVPCAADHIERVLDSPA